MNRTTLVEWIFEALKDLDGRAEIVDVSKHIWQHHQKEIEASGDFFFRWQYDMRWAVQILRKNGRVKTGKNSHRGIWELV